MLTIVFLVGLIPEENEILIKSLNVLAYDF